MKFSIITPTYKRSESLARAVNSILTQTYTDWEMIIVNDSPDDTNYSLFEKSVSDPRIIYLKNKQNEGVNYSRNRALDTVSKDSDWVIFLDDDDYLAPDTLITFQNLATTYPDKKWFITNRAYAKGLSITNFSTSNTSYSYAWDYLITKRGKGDATHSISTSLTKDARFSKLIKQAEEWIFFYQIGLKEHIFYHNHNSTLTNGYNEISGLNFRKRTRGEQFKTLLSIFHEGFNLDLLHHPTFLTYLFMRLIRVFLKS